MDKNAEPVDTKSQILIVNDCLSTQGDSETMAPFDSGLNTTNTTNETTSFGTFSTAEVTDLSESEERKLGDVTEEKHAVELKPIQEIGLLRVDVNGDALAVPYRNNDREAPMEAKEETNKFVAQLIEDGHFKKDLSWEKEVDGPPEEQEQVSMFHHDLKVIRPGHRDFFMSNSTTERTSELFVRDTSGSGRKARQRVVFMEGSIRNVSMIKLEDEVFDVGFRIYLTWLASEEDLEDYEKAVAEGKTSHWRAPSVPRELRVANRQNGSGKLEKRKCRLIVASGYDWQENVLDDGVSPSIMGFDARQGLWIRMKLEFEGTLVEQFELQSFPFDCQDLKIILRCEEDIVFAPLPTQFDYLNFYPGRSTLGDLKVETIGVEFGKTDPQKSRGGRVFGEMIIVLKLKRNWVSALDIMISVAVLTLLSVFVFSIPWVSQLGERMTYLVTLILADITLQQNLKSRLHTTDYLTAIDTFIYVSFLFKIFVLTWVGIQQFPLLESITSDSKETNMAATWVFFLGYVFYLIGTGIYFIIKFQNDHRKNFKSTKELEVNFGIENDMMYRVVITQNTLAVLHYINFYNRFSQYGGPVTYEERTIEETREFINFDEEERSKNLSLRISTVQMLALCGIAVATTYAMNVELLRSRFFRDWIIIESICSVLYLANAWYHRQKSQFLFCDRWIENLAVFVWSIVKFVDPKMESSRLEWRVLWMQSALCGWVFLNLCDDFWFWRKHGGEVDYEEKCRLKWAAVFNVLYVDKQKPPAYAMHPRTPRAGSPETSAAAETDPETGCQIVKQHGRFLLKHFLLGYVQGYRILAMLTPLFIMMSAKRPKNKNRSEIPLHLIWTDCVAGVLGMSAVLLWSLSVINEQIGKSWSTQRRDMTIEETKELANIRKAETVFEQPMGVLLTTKLSQGFSDVNALRAPSYQMTTTENPELSEGIFGFSHVESAPNEIWLDDGPCGKCNPYLWVRYPVQVSVVLLMCSFWCACWVVHPVYFPSWSTVVAPIVSMIWSYVVVSLVENVYDDLHGKKKKYRQYREEVPKFWLGAWCRDV